MSCGLLTTSDLLALSVTASSLWFGLSQKLCSSKTVLSPEQEDLISYQVGSRMFRKQHIENAIDKGFRKRAHRKILECVFPVIDILRKSCGADGRSPSIYDNIREGKRVSPLDDSSDLKVKDH